MFIKIYKLITVCSIIPLLTSCAEPLPKIPDGPVVAPEMAAKAANQVVINHHACGPISLLNSYKFGSEKWQSALTKLRGNSDKKKFNDLEWFGRKISKHTGMIRWDKRRGISAIDLTDVANDFQKTRKTELPDLTHVSLFLKPKEKRPQLLQRVHTELRNSLLRGFPPIITVKRYAHRMTGSRKMWRQVHGHFVVICKLPGKIPADATSFEVKYIDPWGGAMHQGSIKLPVRKFYAIDSSAKHPELKISPTLNVDFPHSNLGRNRLKRNEHSETMIDAAILLRP